MTKPVSVSDVRDLARALLGELKEKPATALLALSAMIDSKADGLGYMGENTLTFAELAMRCSELRAPGFQHFIDKVKARRRLEAALAVPVSEEAKAFIAKVLERLPSLPDRSPKKATAKARQSRKPKAVVEGSKPKATKPRAPRRPRSKAIATA